MCKVLEHLEAGHDVKMGKWSAQEVCFGCLHAPFHPKLRQNGL